jgi:GTPase
VSSREASAAPAGPRVPVVAIAGRPNAGKSTLFNRILRRRRAIVAETPGVTRDENRATLVREGRRFELVDTGGIEETALASGLAERVQARSLAALGSADVVVYVVDGKAGLSAADRAVADRIRALGVPLVLAVNKVDREEHRQRVIDFHALGADDPVAVSAAHGLGVDELWTRVEAALDRVGLLPSEEVPSPGGDDEAEPPVSDTRVHGPPRLALIGRPNVGKSSLLNRLAGFERALVDASPGTTRDSIDVELERAGRRYVVVDTAGLRRPSRIVETIEGFAAASSLRAIERAEVAVLVLDAVAGVSDQDLRLADLVWRRGRGFVIAVNKVDLAPKLAAEQCHDVIARRLPQWPPVPLVRVSALTGTGLGTLVTAVDTVVAAYRRRMPTPQLNSALRAAVEAHPPALVRGRPPKLLYAAQVRTGPQEVAIVTSRPDAFTAEYRRYLTHRLREAGGLVGVPLRLKLKERARPRREAAKGGKAGRSGRPLARRAASR